MGARAGRAASWARRSALPVREQYKGSKEQEAGPPYREASASGATRARPGPGGRVAAIPTWGASFLARGLKCVRPRPLRHALARPGGLGPALFASALKPRPACRSRGAPGDRAEIGSTLRIFRSLGSGVPASARTRPGALPFIDGARGRGLALLAARAPLSRVHAGSAAVIFVLGLGFIRAWDAQPSQGLAANPAVLFSAPPEVVGPTTRLGLLNASGGDRALQVVRDAALGGAPVRGPLRAQETEHADRGASPHYPLFVFYWGPSLPRKPFRPRVPPRARPPAAPTLSAPRTRAVQGRPGLSTRGGAERGEAGGLKDRRTAAPRAARRRGRRRPGAVRRARAAARWEA